MKKGGEIVALLWYVIKLLVLILTCSASDCLYFPSWFAPVCVQSLWQIRGQFWWSLVNLCVSFRYFRSVVVHNVARVQISDLQNCNSCDLKASEREYLNFHFSVCLLHSLQSYSCGLSSVPEAACQNTQMYYLPHGRKRSKFVLKHLDLKRLPFENQRGDWDATTCNRRVSSCHFQKWV